MPNTNPNPNIVTTLHNFRFANDEDAIRIAFNFFKFYFRTCVRIKLCSDWCTSNFHFYVGYSKSNQINSWFSAPPTARTMTHYIVQISSISMVGSLEEECFQGVLKSWHGTHQLDYCWQPVLCLRCSNREHPLTEFQTGPGDDIIAVRCRSKSRPQWDISDCSQHTSQVGWCIANHHFVHYEAQFVVDPLLDRQPVQLLECWRHVIVQVQTIH